jgi:hypothetical protein
MSRVPNRVHLGFLALALIALALPRFHGREEQAPKPPSDFKFIDSHVHAMSVTPPGLRAVA